MRSDRRQRGPSTFRQRDLTVALKALKAAGIPVARIEIGNGGVVIFPAHDGDLGEIEPNPWDEDN